MNRIPVSYLKEIQNCAFECLVTRSRRSFRVSRAQLREILKCEARSFGPDFGIDQYGTAD